MPVCSDRLCSADVDASSFDVLLSLQTLRIAIHRRKGTTLKLLFIVVPFSRGSFTLFKDRKLSCLPSSLLADALYWLSLHQLTLSVSGFGTSVWTGRAFQAGFDDLETIVLRFCIRPVNEAASLLAIMDIRAHPISFSERP
jgi:hypothetical protein